MARLDPERPPCRCLMVASAVVRDGWLVDWLSPPAGWLAGWLVGSIGGIYAEPPPPSAAQV